MEVVNKILTIVGMWELIALVFSTVAVMIAGLVRSGKSGEAGDRGPQGEAGRDGKMAVDTLLDEEIVRLMARMEEITKSRELVAKPEPQFFHEEPLYNNYDR